MSKPSFTARFVRLCETPIPIDWLSVPTKRFVIHPIKRFVVPPIRFLATRPIALARHFWCRRRIFARRLLWTTLVGATSLALFYAEENWRGRRAWQLAVEAYEAGGESLSPELLSGRSIPDEDNFGAIEFLRGMTVSLAPEDPDYYPPGGTMENSSAPCRRLYQVWDHPFENRQQFSELARQSGDSFEIRKPADLSFLHDYFLSNGIMPVRPDPDNKLLDVLEALEAEHGEVFRALAAGTDRPHAQFVPPSVAQVDHEEFIYGPPLPHLQSIQLFCRPLKYRASLAIRVGDRQRARESIAIAMKLREATASGGIIIEVLVANAVTSIFRSPIWEVLQSRSWDETQLHWLQMELGKIDYADEILDGWRREIAYLVRVRSTFKTRGARSSIESTIMGGAHLQKLVWNAKLIDLGPSGWIDQNAAAYLRWSHEKVIKPMREKGLAGLEDVWKIGQPALSENWVAFAPDWWPLMFGLTYKSGLYESGSGLPLVIAFSQTVIDQAELACALERFFLKNARYPENLQQLVPEWIDEIPQDWVDGEPMRYRTTADGRYLLYSLGQNREDDGGTAAELVHKPNSWPHRPRDRGDWVWGYSPD